MAGADDVGGALSGPLDTFGKRLGAGLTAATGVITLVGTQTGALGRLVRNASWSLGIGVGLIVLGILVGFLTPEKKPPVKTPEKPEPKPITEKTTDTTKTTAGDVETTTSVETTQQKDPSPPGGGGAPPAAPQERDWPRILWTVASLAFILIGMSWLAWTSVRVNATIDRPGLTAKVVTTEAGLLRLEGTIKAEGLRADQWVLVVAKGRSRSAEYSCDGCGGGAGRVAPVDPPGDTQSETILAFQAGPDADGKVESSYDAPVSTGIYESLLVTAEIQTSSAEDDEDDEDEASEPPSACDVSLSVACIAITLPQRYTQPSVRASLEQADTGTTLTVDLSMDGLNADESVLLTILESSGGPVFTVAHQAEFASGGTSSVAVEGVKVPLRDDAVEVCLGAVRIDKLGAPALALLGAGTAVACPDDDLETAVLRLEVPNLDEAAVRPSVVATVSGALEGMPFITVGVSGSELGATEAIRLRVGTTETDATAFQVIYDAFLVPDGGGSVAFGATAPVAIPIDVTVVRACVLAEVISAIPDAPAAASIDCLGMPANRANETSVSVPTTIPGAMDDMTTETP